MAIPSGQMERSHNAIIDPVSSGETKNPTVNKSLDRLRNELRFRLVFKSGLDLVFERLAGGGAGFCGVCEFGLEPVDAFFRSAKGRNFSKCGMAGDKFRFALEVADDGIEVGVPGDNVEIALGIGGNDAAEFQSEHKVECVAAVHRSLDDAELFGMILGEEKEGGRFVEKS